MLPKVPLVDYLIKNAGRFGGKVFVEEQYKKTGRIDFPNGNICHFISNNIDINLLGSTEVARDKDYTNLYLTKLGYNTIKGKVFFGKKWASFLNSKKGINKAISYAKDLGFPVFIKPNNGTKGRGVSEATSEKQFKKFFKEALRYDKNILVQKSHRDKTDYRIVVFNDQVYISYKKEPFFIVGDGKKSIKQLMLDRIERILKEGREVKTGISDYRIKEILKKQSLNLKTVLAENRKVELLPNSNLSQAGSAIDCSSNISPEWRKWAVDITEKMNLKFCGIDVLVKGDLTADPENTDHVVLELNPTPGFSHYMAVSAETKDNTYRLFEDILKYLAKEK